MTVARSHHAREAAKLHEAWPEIRDKATQAKVMEAVKSYGIDEDTLNSTHDHRFYLILRDAIAYREGRAKQTAAAKVVTAKPKIVSGAARQSGKSDGAARDAMARLSETGSMDDAVRALRGLLN